jgi:hypothetical protein
MSSPRGRGSGHGLLGNHTVGGFWVPDRVRVEGAMERVDEGVLAPEPLSTGGEEGARPSSMLRDGRRSAGVNSAPCGGRARRSRASLRPRPYSAASAPACGPGTDGTGRLSSCHPEHQTPSLHKSATHPPQGWSTWAFCDRFGSDTRKTKPSAGEGSAPGFLYQRIEHV